MVPEHLDPLDGDVLCLDHVLDCLNTHAVGVDSFVSPPGLASPTSPTLVDDIDMLDLLDLLYTLDIDTIVVRSIVVRSLE